MAAGLKLNAVTDIGSGRYRSKDAIFDFSRMYDEKIKLQEPQALDLGFRTGMGPI